MFDLAFSRNLNELLSRCYKVICKDVLRKVHNKENNVNLKRPKHKLNLVLNKQKYLPIKYKVFIIHIVCILDYSKYFMAIKRFYNIRKKCKNYLKIQEPSENSRHQLGP